MAEINTAQKALYAANKKVSAADHNRVRVATVTMPAAWTGDVADTAGSMQIVPAGSRILDVKLACAGGAAGSTLSVGLRHKTDGDLLVADALAATEAISAAANKSVVSGSLVGIAGDDVTTFDGEIFLTFAGAAPQANQVIRVMVAYIAP